LNRQINAEAARWFVEFRSGDMDASGRQAFDAWLRASPEHLRAFIEIAALWGYAPALDPQRRFSPEALVASARQDSNIIPLGAGSHSGESPQPPGRPGKRISGMRLRAAAALLIVGVLATWSMLHDRESYETQVLEQRSLRLSDGSTVTLNSKSRARIEFSDSRRAVDLVEGEALFRVAQDSSRPFVVHAGGTFVLAIGTEFDINQTRRGTMVTVLEGRVAVGPGRGRTGSRSVHAESMEASGTVEANDGRADGTVLLSAGEQVEVAAGTTDTRKRTNVSSTTAWVQRKVILQSATLEEVAEDFNRYSERPLIVEEHAAVPFRLSGVFSTDPRFLIRFLRERPDIQVRETASEIRIIHTGVS
jgi:transmembrane sensor